MVNEGTFRVIHCNRSEPLTVGKASPQSPSRFAHPCWRWQASPALLYLEQEPVHIYSFGPYTLLGWLFYCPALVFVLRVLFMHTAGGPMFNLSSGLNITCTIARGIRACQPLSSVCVNSTPGRRPGAGASSTFMGVRCEMETVTSSVDDQVQRNISSYHRLGHCFVSCVHKARVSKS